MHFTHEPVLLQETLQALDLKAGETYVDCTLGGAGHSLGMLAQEPTIRLIGIDQDAEALERAKYRLTAYNPQVALVRDNFRNLRAILQRMEITQSPVSSWILECRHPSLMTGIGASVTTKTHASI